MNNGAYRVSETEVNTIIRFIKNCFDRGLIVVPESDDDKYELAAKFADEIFGSSGLYQYSERQVATLEIYEIFTEK